MYSHPPPHKMRPCGSVIFISNDVEFFNLKIVPGFITFVQEMKILSRDRLQPVTYYTKCLAFFGLKSAIPKHFEKIIPLYSTSLDVYLVQV